MHALSSQHLPIKSVCVPLSPPVDISRFLPLIDHPEFQKLKWRKQLGVNYLVFPGAVHTRFEHTIGVLGLTQRLVKHQGLSREAGHHLCAFALVHDLGHGPFSHQIEPILTGTHHARGRALLGTETMTRALDACGLDPAALEALGDDRDPLGRFVSDRNLGTDKLDYLLRDALHIGFTGMPEIEKVQLYTVLVDGVPAIEEKFTEDIKRIQKFYSYLHQHGYLNKTALSVQRLFQRAVQEELEASGIDSDRLWAMTDPELIGWLRHGRSRRGRALIECCHSRDFHRSALVIKPEGYGFVERCSGKPVAVREWSPARLRRFSRVYSCCERVRELEDALAASVGLDRGELLFAAMPFFDKLIPRDVRIFSNGKAGNFWLFEKDRDHYRSLEGDYLRTFAIRVIVPPASRAAVVRKAEELVAGIDAELAKHSEPAQDGRGRDGQGIRQ